MDKKSFLRGFGAGVLFTAIILGISFTIRTSDSYVSSRAKELGMVYEESSDSDLKLARKEPEVTASATGAPEDAEQKKAKSTAVPKTDSPATKAPTQAPTATPKPTKKPSSQKSNTSDTKKKMEEEKKRMEQEIRKEEKSLTINAGEWSSDVSQKLEDLGIVKSAKDFDKYLNDNGYSSSISAGTYKVSVEDTYNELARKITGR